MDSLFENLVIREALKSRHHQGRPPSLSVFRDSHSRKIDLIHDSGRKLTGIEIKSSTTYHDCFKKRLLHFQSAVAPLAKSYTVHNSERHTFSDGIEAVPVSRTHELVE